MTVSNELLQAILALDSYNRGYDPGVNLEGNSLGGYTILTDSEEAFRIPDQDPNTPSPAAAASFYAVAYKDSAGNIVISYRGTDDPSGDAFTGWTTGGGAYDSAQAKLAAEFYAKVKEAHPDASITLTGHSLGGGLAGLIAKLTGCPAYIYEALLHKSSDGRGYPFPGRTYPTASVTGMPSAVKPFRTATRTWNSAT